MQNGYSAGQHKRAAISITGTDLPSERSRQPRTWSPRCWCGRPAAARSEAPAARKQSRTLHSSVASDQAGVRRAPCGGSDTRARTLVGRLRQLPALSGRECDALAVAQRVQTGLNLLLLLVGDCAPQAPSNASAKPRVNARCMLAALNARSGLRRGWDALYVAGVDAVGLGVSSEAFTAQSSELDAPLPPCATLATPYSSSGPSRRTRPARAPCAPPA